MSRDLVPESTLVASAAVARWIEPARPWARMRPQGFADSVREAYDEYCRVNSISLLCPSALGSSALVGCLSRQIAPSPLGRHGERTTLLLLRPDGQLAAVSETSPHPLADDQALALMRASLRRTRGTLLPDYTLPSLLMAAERSAHARSIGQQAAGALGGELRLPLGEQSWQDTEIKRLIISQEVRRLHAGARRFLRLLDPAILRALAATSAQSIVSYSHYAHPETGRNRQQAALAFPVLMPVILETPALLQTVDRGGKLLEALAEALALPVALLRRLRGVPARFIPPLSGQSGPPAMADLRALLDALREVPVDHIPSGRKAWISFLALWQARDVHAVNMAGHHDCERILASFRGRWVETAEAVLAAAHTPSPSYGQPAERIAMVRRVLRDANDLVAAVATALITPVLVAALVERLALSAEAAVACVNGLADMEHRPLHRLASEMLYDKQSLVQLVRKSTDCHATPSLFGQFTTANRWEPIFSTTLRSPNGIEIHALYSATALTAEGAAMNHCVAGYAARCSYEGHHILSLRQADGTRLSTVELARIVNRAEVTVLQHKGPHNEGPVPAAAVALDWLIASIASGAIVLEISELERRRAQRLSLRGRHILGSQHDGVTAAWAAWRRHLVRPWSVIGLDAFEAMITNRILTSEYLAACVARVRASN